MNMSKTKVNVPAPPPRGRPAKFLAAIPKGQDAPQNLGTPSSDDELKNVNFKMSPAFHDAFKLEAHLRKMSMKELLDACFKEYLRAYPRSQIERRQRQGDLYEEGNV